MKIFLSIILLAVQSGSAISASPDYYPFRDAENRLKNESDANSRILNGTEVRIRDNPWQVALLNAQDPYPVRAQFCGGTIIQASWVVTAAHCVDRGITEAQIVVFSNSENLLLGGSRFLVEKIFLHKKWNRNTGDNDIALLRVAVSEGKKMGAPIVTNTEKNIPVKSAVWITGWGMTEARPSGTSSLQGVEIQYIHPLTCAKEQSYGAQFTVNMICAGARKKDTCEGDSGGPATAVVAGERRLIGVTSSGGQCGDPSKPGLYTKVANYIDWITETLK
jgi:secreted trypsin-like serine protease